MKASNPPPKTINDSLLTSSHQEALLESITRPTPVTDAALAATLQSLRGDNAALWGDVTDLHAILDELGAENDEQEPDVEVAELMRLEEALMAEVAALEEPRGGVLADEFLESVRYDVVDEETALVRVIEELDEARRALREEVRSGDVGSSLAGVLLGVEMGREEERLVAAEVRKQMEGEGEGERVVELPEDEVENGFLRDIMRKLTEDSAADGANEEVMNPGHQDKKRKIKRAAGVQGKAVLRLLELMVVADDGVVAVDFDDETSAGVAAFLARAGIVEKRGEGVVLSGSWRKGKLGGKPAGKGTN